MLIAISLIMIRLIRFSDIERWKNIGRWVLVYGRRKTGKSFFIRNFIDYDSYFFVSRNREIFIDYEKLSYEAFVREVFRLLSESKVVVIDEIQRLPQEFFDRLHNFGVKGNLIAVSSTIWIAKSLLGERSPLLGLFSEFNFQLIDEADILRNLIQIIDDPRKLVEYAVFLREPWLVPLFEKAADFMSALASNIRFSIPALVGEIFLEEDRTFTSVYEGILKAVANGKRVSTEITNTLFSLKLIPMQNPSLVHPYLKILTQIGLLDKVKVYGKRKYYYYHTSPLTDLYYYADSKYGISERDVPEDQMRKILELKIPFYVEHFFAKLLARTFGLWREILVTREFEVDIALTDFKRLKVVGEVKWKNYIDRREINDIEDVLSKFNCKRMLIVPEEDVIEKFPEKVEVWDVHRIIKELLL